MTAGFCVGQGTPNRRSIIQAIIINKQMFFTNKKQEKLKNFSCCRFVGQAMPDKNCETGQARSARQSRARCLCEGLRSGAETSVFQDRTSVWAYLPNKISSQNDYK